MTKDEALKLALKALETELSIDWTNNDEFNASAEKMHEAMIAIKEALANVATNDTSQERVDEMQKQRHEQEPVGEVYGWHGTGKGQPMCRFNATEAEMPVGTKLYTSPPAQRTWVGLTDEEKNEFATSLLLRDRSTVQVFEAIEAKLKQKNNG